MSSQGDRPGHDDATGRHAAELRPLTSVRTRQAHIAYVARKYTDSPLTTLSHHLDMLWMREAFSRVKRDSAPGIDGVTVAQYAENLEANLAELLELAKSGRYRTPPVKRAYIPKNEKETRPIGLPTVADKVLQRAVVMLLEPIYETDFLDCSYGFRPRRSAHQALDAMREALKEFNGGWVLDVDIRSYFDTIPHSQLKEILRHRVKDSVILRLLAKWLRAGVLEDGVVTVNDDGTPQGGVASPLLPTGYQLYLSSWYGSINPDTPGFACRDVYFVVPFNCCYHSPAEPRKPWFSWLSKNQMRPQVAQYYAFFSFPGRAPGYPKGSPTDPDERD